MSPLVNDIMTSKTYRLEDIPSSDDLEKVKDRLEKTPESRKDQEYYEFSTDFYRHLNETETDSETFYGEHIINDTVIEGLGSALGAAVFTFASRGDPVSAANGALLGYIGGKGMSQMKNYALRKTFEK